MNNFKSKPTVLSSFLLIALSLLIPSTLSAHGVSVSDQELLYSGGLGSYVLVGAKHMITGYDHLLFLVGVLFYLNNTKDIIKFITVFTIGHCLTLIGATLLGIQANEHLVDAVIALSVLYKGFENLGGFPKIFHTQSPNLLAMVGIFGLIHGFGLSTRLQSFDMGAGPIFAKIISFNIGVELGQIAALIPIVFFMQLWKNKSTYALFHTSTNWGLVSAGIGLFIFQLYAYSVDML